MATAPNQRYIGDGSMFKIGTYNAVATEIMQLHTLGPAKTSKGKW